MSNINIFEQASRIKLRFETSKGMLSVEDLWSLPLTSETGKVNLDDLARSYHIQLKEANEVSFVRPAKKNAELQLAFDLVKYVIEVKMAEAATASEARNKAALKDKINEIIVEKEIESLKGKSLEELKAIANSL